MGRARGDNRGSLSDADPLWSKAPFVLFRYPGLFVSIAVGALLLALAASAYPLFISASASELVRGRIHDPSYTRWAVGEFYRNGALPIEGFGPHADVPGDLDELWNGIVADDPYLGHSVTSALSKVVPVTKKGFEDEGRDARLMFGEDAESNIDILEGTPGDGAIVPDLVSDALGISPGDEIVIGSPEEGQVTLPVDAIYRSLYKGGDSGYWRPWHDELVLYCPNCAPPAQAVIVPRDTFATAAGKIGLDHTGYAWAAPITRDLTLQEAEDAARIAKSISAEIDEKKLMNRCYIGFFCSRHSGPTWGSAIDDVVREVHSRLVSIEGPAELLRVAGVLVALVVVAGAGAFAMATRRVESALLFARGARPRAVGGRAALEALLPCVAGAAAGLGLAIALVRGFGPNGMVASDATRQAVLAAVISAAAAILAIAIVSTVSFLRQSEHHRSRFAVLGKVPWEIVPIALSLLILRELRTGGAVTIDRALNTETPSLLLFAFPVLFLAGFVALAARGIVWFLRRARRRSGGYGIPAFLATHRLASRPRLTMLLITASGLCLGLFVQAQMVARSMATTVNAKAGVYVGSDVQARIDDVNATPTDFPFPLTRVERRPFAGQLRADVPFDLVGIDADTFASAAFWDPAFSDEPLSVLLSRLSEGEGDAVPIVVASSGETPTHITIDTRTVPVKVVGRADAFPGMLSRRPLVVVDSDRLVEAFEGQANPLSGPAVSDELWVRGPPAAIRAALPDLSFQPSLVLTADEVKDIPYIAAVIDTFLVMNGLGLLAALLVFAAMVMYLQARQRSEVVSYGLSLRMGMRKGAHLLATATEVGAMLVIAYAVGAVLAITAAQLTVPLLDPLETIPPDPIGVVPVVTLAIAAPVLLLAALAGGWLVERRARAADLGQVMRLAD
jgi:putative ABC transport system permease protein